MPSAISEAIDQYRRCKKNPESKVQPRDPQVAAPIGLPMVQFMLPGAAMPHRTMVEAAEEVVGLTPATARELVQQIDVCLEVTGIADETDDTSRILVATLRTARAHLMSPDSDQE